MRIHILQNSSETPPGTVLEWLKVSKRECTLVKLFDGEKVPRVEDTDFVIVLGGPMNVDEVEACPWLLDEKDFLRQLIIGKKTCLGICLGGQLLAQILGGTVTRHEHWEVGWHAITIGPTQRLMVFQWHQDTFTIPPGAVRVATNRICENQAFAFGDNVVGVQFHPEATEEWIAENAADPEQPTGPHVQNPGAMLEERIFCVPMKKWFFELLDQMARKTAQSLKGAS